MGSVQICISPLPGAEITDLLRFQIGYAVVVDFHVFTEEMLLSECLLDSAKFACVLKSYVLVLFSVLVEASGVVAGYAGSSIPAELFVGWHPR